MTIHVSLEKANLNSLNVSTPDFCIWQHIGSNWSISHIQKLANVPEIPVTKLYRHLICQSKPILSFEMNRSSKEGGPFLIAKLLTNPGTYMGFLSTIIIASITIYYLMKFGADLPHQGTEPIPQPHCDMPLWVMM